MPRDKTGHFYYSWYPTIYQADTQALSLAADGAYRRLIDYYMLTRSPISNNDQAIARIVGCDVNTWINEIKTQLVIFFKTEGNLWHHAFCDQVIEKDTSRIIKSKSNGSKGGRPIKHDNKRKITHPVTEVKPLTELNRTEEKKESKKESKTTGSRFTLTELPAEWKDFCLKERPDLNPENVFIEFRDYWISVAGQRGRKADWFATWRNRVRDKKSQQTNLFARKREIREGAKTL